MSDSIKTLVTGLRSPVGTSARLDARIEAKRLIAQERIRQIKLWGNGPMPKDIRMDVLVEEVGEVAKARQEEGPERVMEELVQVGAVALRWVEDMILEAKEHE